MRLACTEGGFYYHVNVRTYPEGTVLPSWSSTIERLIASLEASPQSEWLTRGREADDLRGLRLAQFERCLQLRRDLGLLLAGEEQVAD